MTRFAFWNIQRRPLEALIAEMAKRHDLDIILLAESEIDPKIVVAALKSSTDDRYSFFGTHPARRSRLADRLYAYFRLGRSLIEPIFPESARRFKIFRLHEANPLAIDTLLVLAHAPSKFLGSGKEDQMRFFRSLRRGIEEAEGDAGHRNTILVGDMNVDPFERRVASVSGISGVATREVARQVHRRYDGQRHRLFYNPMWCLYGDRRSSHRLADDVDDSGDPVVPGTYYLAKNFSHRLYWHMYDQVLIRPGLIERFPLSELRIVGRLGDWSFLRTGKPTPSDHLPILFQVDLREGTADAD
jgi:hypothetical protein